MVLTHCSFGWLSGMKGGKGIEYKDTSRQEAVVWEGQGSDRKNIHIWCLLLKKKKNSLW